MSPLAGARRQVLAFDRLVDEGMATHLRGRRPVDVVMYGASFVGDHGLIWMGVAGLQALRRRDRPWGRPLARAVLGLAAESAVVNGPVKWMFRRARPVSSLPRPHHLRQPRSSSFPSGHASAAFFGAALLRNGDPWWPVYYGLAVVVATSRAHVRIHHASDVVGGAVVGAALGELTRRLVPLDGPATTIVPSPSGSGGTGPVE